MTAMPDDEESRDAGPGSRPPGERRPGYGEVHEGLDDLVRAVERYKHGAGRRPSAADAVRGAFYAARDGLAAVAALPARLWRALRRRFPR
ncbi:hypothetical protein Skr01_26360 [Sphaerisporangium krabiense]|uniref:Uncharacterized protein n=1 Tax=Sphaerisporangium krabiense TaxID=763782 RepID=A0A7W8ZAT6_9ACTN|nr:hypothetical protein [Sphaerisporangium krabiense]MBB5630495.1 hypothetical protein [Sphaerisporangium krabiense]GII62551.1 hypothetical protein Skr01_26360 [Sphaerisporangium krabiense]